MPTESVHVPRFLFLTQEFQHKVLPLGPESKNSTVIGRSDLADFTVEDPMVSTAHCEIGKVNDHIYTISDLNSTNGTYVNGMRLGKDHVILANGDVVKVGRVEMIYMDEAASDLHHNAKTVINIEEVSDSVPNIKNMSPFYIEEGGGKTGLVMNCFIGVLAVAAVICVVIFLFSVFAA